MAFDKTLISVDGLLRGHLPYHEGAWTGYTPIYNQDLGIVNENGADGVQNDLFGVYIEAPYEFLGTLPDWVGLFKIPLRNSDGDLVRYIVYRYKYSSYFAFGRSRITVNTQFGYQDLQGNFTEMSGSEIKSYSSEDGTWHFKLRVRLCMGHVDGNTPFDFFGCVMSVYAQDRDMYCYGGLIESRAYVQGDLEPGGVFDPSYGPSSEPEGYEVPGGYDDHSDIISLPPKPQSILSLGFLNVYKCAANALQDFGAAMFPEIQFPQSLSDVGEVLAAFSDSIWNSKLIDYVVSVHCVPGDVTAGELEDIKVGARTMTGILARKITNEYVDFSFGSINVAPYFKNYADYMTEIQLYLPGYGFISLRPEEIIGGEISVTYRFNVLDGSFMAYVFSTSNRSKLKTSLIGQYGGSCIVHLPVSNLSYSSMFSNMVGGAASAAMGVASGGAGAVAGALAATSMATQAAQGGDVKKSNSYNASSSFMARLQPYVIVTRPYPSFSQRYNLENGFPSNVSMTIGSCTGFTTAENAILDGIPCTDAEKEKIRNLLKSGIVIRS